MFVPLRSVAALTLTFLLLLHVAPVSAAGPDETAADPAGSQEAEATEVAEEEAELVFPIPTVVVIGKRIDAPPTQITRVVGLVDFTAWNAAQKK